jgi:hypothetical protein
MPRPKTPRFFRSATDSSLTYLPPSEASIATHPPISLHFPRFPCGNIWNRRNRRSTNRLQPNDGKHFPKKPEKGSVSDGPIMQQLLQAHPPVWCGERRAQEHWPA